MSAHDAPASDQLIDECADRSSNKAYAQAYGTAIKLLGARDHSRHELGHKLAQRKIPSALIDTVLNELVEMGYLNDERFAQLYAEQRLARGYGPLAIRAKLQERSVDSALITAAIDGLDVNWQSVATDALQRRYSADELLDASDKQRGRVARFLHSRGFSTSDALRALTCATQSVSEQG